MENVSLSVPPEDPADIYIPTIHAEQEQAHSPCSSSSAADQAMHMPTIRYTPSSATVPPPLVAAGTRTAIVAAETPAFFQYRATHTTFCTQVFAAQTFSYPPTPPLDGPCSAEPERGQEHLSITQGPAGLDYPADNHHAPTSINPFPSLPTPPDIEAIHHHQQQNTAHVGPPPLASDGEGNSSPITTTSPHSLKQNGVMDVTATSQWPGQPGASSICFVPPAQASVSPQMFQFNTRRPSPSALQPAIYYPAAAVSMQQQNAMGQLQGQRAVPPLVKGLDGEMV